MLSSPISTDCDCDWPEHVSLHGMSYQQGATGACHMKDGCHRQSPLSQACMNSTPCCSHGEHALRPCSRRNQCQLSVPSPLSSTCTLHRCAHARRMYHHHMREGPLTWCMWYCMLHVPSPTPGHCGTACCMCRPGTPSTDSRIRPTGTGWTLTL